MILHVVLHVSTCTCPCPKDLYIAFLCHSALTSEQREITSDVNHLLHHVNQFTEVRYFERFNIDLSDDLQAVEKNDGEPNMSAKNPRHPHQVEWELFSFDGTMTSLRL